MLDIHLRLQSKEQTMMIDALKKIQKKDFVKGLSFLSSGKNYHRSVPPEIEKDLMVHFKKYLESLGE